MVERGFSDQLDGLLKSKANAIECVFLVTKITR